MAVLRLIWAARASNPLYLEPLIERQADVSAHDDWESLSADSPDW